MAIKREDKKGARYRRILLEMHADQKFRALTSPPPSGQSLWLQLLIGPFTTLIPGLLVVGEAGFAERLRWPVEEFRRCLKEITDQEMAQVDWEGPLIFLPNALKHNPPHSPSVVTGWRQTWAEIPACALKTVAARQIRAALVRIGTAYAKAFDGISGGVGNPNPANELSQVEPQNDPQDASQVDAQSEPQDNPQIGTQTAPHQDQEQDQDLSPPTPSRREGERVFRRGDTRRPHPLDERVKLEPWSLAAFDSFIALYPRKEGEMRALRVWHELHPDEETAELIVAHLRLRVDSGWMRDRGPGFIPMPHTFLDCRMWQEKYHPRPPVVSDKAVSTSAVPDVDETARMLDEHRKAAQR